MKSMTDAMIKNNENICIIFIDNNRDYDSIINNKYNRD